MAVWLEIFLALAVALVIGGVLSLVWLLVDRLRSRRSGRSDRVGADQGAGSSGVVRGSMDVRDHWGPVVERQGPGVTERRVRDVIDRTSGENPRT